MGILQLTPLLFSFSNFPSKEARLLAFGSTSARVTSELSFEVASNGPSGGRVRRKHGFQRHGLDGEVEEGPFDERALDRSANP